MTAKQQSGRQCSCIHPCISWSSKQQQLAI